VANYLEKIHIQNFRSLADVSIEAGALNVLFGPNGAGKSSFLDVLSFVRDCADRGVDLASSLRSHGIGVLWDKAEEGARISVELTTRSLAYELRLGLSSGRIETHAGERLRSRDGKIEFLERDVGSSQALFRHAGQEQQVTLREPERLCLLRYADWERGPQGAFELLHNLQHLRSYSWRSFHFNKIKHAGSEASSWSWLLDSGDNLWSNLRNMSDRRRLDTRYETVIHYMRKAFPSFDEVVIEQTGPASVYASFLERGRRRPILASGVSDGHLQMLILLTALFCEHRGLGYQSLMLFDEPETSLHPYAIVVLAEAMKLAAREWDRQIFVATHSPVLMSQFETSEVLTTSLEDGATRITRVSEMQEIKDLLEHYPVGSLYMAGEVAPQGPSGGEETPRV
jgi:predicted ATPase